MGKVVGARIELRAMYLAAFVFLLAAVAAGRAHAGPAEAGTLVLAGFVGSKQVEVSEPALMSGADGTQMMTLAVIAESSSYTIVPSIVGPRPDSPGVLLERNKTAGQATLVLAGRGLDDSHARETVRVVICVK